jgi:hypothetical protein
MRRREFIAIASGVAAWPLVAHAQRRQSAPRIGYLSDETAGPHPFNSHGSVSRALRSLGYEEGRNVTIEYRYAAGRVERLPSLAAELAALPVDVIFSVGTVVPRKQLSQQLRRSLLFSRALVIPSVTVLWLRCHVRVATLRAPLS